MHRSFLFIFLLIPTLCLSQDISLTGDWKEILRIKDQKPKKYDDTLYMSFTTNKKCLWGRQNGLALSSDYYLKKDEILLGDMGFPIKVINQEEFELTFDAHTVLRLKKYIKVPDTTDNRAATSSARSPNNTSGNFPQTIDQLLGSWKCYKRKSDAPLEMDKKYRMIRLFEVIKKNDTLNALLYGFSDLENAPSWYIVEYKDGVLYADGKDKRSFEILDFKEAKELVIKNEGIIYYMNPGS
jgi:hypothetical protein